MATPDPSLVLFARGVIARLNTWDVLRVAVDQSWGGPDSAEKRIWMSSVIVDSFDPSQNKEVPDDVYVEEQLLQMMSDEFETNLEDGTAEIVAKDIMKLWSNLQDEQAAQLVVEQWESAAQKSKGKAVLVQIVDESVEVEGSDSEGDEEDSDAEDDEAPQLLQARQERAREEPEVDEEGFTVVKKKGASHR